MTASQLPINQNLVAGIDVGGTKVHIADNSVHQLHKYHTNAYPDLYALLEEYMQAIGQRPVRIAIVVAGPRDDDTGAIKITNADWPLFSPVEAGHRYPGTTFYTANDMIGATAGVLHESGVELLELKPGTAALTGTKLVMAMSTGLGAAAAVWEERTKRYVYLAGEGGHIGFQPKTSEEIDYLRFLNSKHSHASAELALSGRHGIENLVTHSLASHTAPQLSLAIERARNEDRPIGAVLLEFASEGHGPDKQTATHILGLLGAMAGSVIRDLAVVFNATGGVYLTGSVALGLGEYLASNTSFIERFIHPGAVHDHRLQNVPIYLVTDPDVAVRGALALALDY